MINVRRNKALRLLKMEVEMSQSEPRSEKFILPVDSEHKSTIFKINSVAPPHMRAFHLSWISFFTCFVSSFAAPPLLPIIRDNLNLTATQIADAGIAAVSGAVFARIAMGTACDLIGPRLASASLILLTAPAVYLTSIIDSSLKFFLVRFFTGFSLATFVSTQFWMTSLFSPPVVGTANAVAGGWGNLGGGATQLIMPLVYSIIQNNIGANNFTAWRIAFFVPAIMQTASAYAVFFLGQDLPDGNFAQVRKSDDFRKVIYNAVTNYRGWITGLTYGYCFGVELTIDNIIAQYFFDRFDVKLHTAGIIAASFGLANLFSRPGGGWLSDIMGRRFGMRGRIWALWIIQSLGGLFCIILGKVSSLSTSMAVMIIFSIFVQAACGLTFGVVPFISRRSLGVISGMTGGGGNVGAVITQVIFFRGSRYATEDGISLMGVMIIACTLPLFLIYFPQWGSMFSGPSSNSNSSEQEYYLGEWSQEEIEKGLHQGSLKFADNSKNERGKKMVDSAPTPPSHRTPSAENVY